MMTCESVHKNSHSCEHDLRCFTVSFMVLYHQNMYVSFFLKFYLTNNQLIQMNVHYRGFLRTTHFLNSSIRFNYFKIPVWNYH